MLNFKIGRVKFLLLFILLFIVHFTALRSIPKSNSEIPFIIEWLIYMGLLCCLSLPRLRDLNKSFWKALYFFIPILNLYLFGQLAFKKAVLPCENIDDQDWKNEHYNR